ncbi:hypothetical protein EJB05_26553 [Eragrostis curvula]|uniref:Uncharacterized protein n=1 Tax=Eragrostis curvula TaxID=38414 RepID=A0A5J9UKA9_9POAL|nr:hypothetical protein EJB05_26553 [Eragrostis curvula]
MRIKPPCNSFSIPPSPTSPPGRVHASPILPSVATSPDTLSLACAFPEIHSSDCRALWLQGASVCVPCAHETDSPLEFTSLRSRVRCHRRHESGRAQRESWKPQKLLSVVINLTPEDHVHGVTKAFVICILVPLTHVSARPEPALKTSAFQFCQRVIDFADVNVNVPAVLLRDASTGFPVSVLLFLHPRDISLVFSTSNLSVKLPFNVHDTQVPACDHKDRFVERQPRTTAQSTGLIMVDLVKYYANFPVLPAFMERGRKGYFQTQVMEGYS